MIEYISLNDNNLPIAHEIYNRNMEYDPIPLDIFRYKTLEDPDFDPSIAIVAVYDGKPCGMMMGVCRKTDDGVSAGIKLFAVDEEYRNQKVASEMLTKIETEVKARGAKSLNIGFTRPNYITPGLDPRYTLAAAFLIRRGFNKGSEAFNMDVDLSVSDWSTDDIEARLEKDGITCRRLRPDEKERLADYMKSVGHSSGWTYQTLRAAEQDPVGVFIAEQNGDIIAFACYDGVRPGWFGPMGTKETVRGGGIGSVTYLKCMQSMKEVGYKTCHINCVGPLYFYSKTSNAKVSRVFWQFSKPLE